MRFIPRRKKDFLDEIIEGTTRDSPEFPSMVEAALNSRRLLRELAMEREALGLTQAEVANRMATSQPAVARLEAGETDAKLSTVARYATALGRKIEWKVSKRSRSRPRKISA